MSDTSKAPVVNGSELIEAWRRMEREARPKDPPDPLLERIRERAERIRARVGVLDDSVPLIREDRNR